MMDNNKYFQCFSPVMNRFLRDEKKIKYIVKGLHPDTKRTFFLYEKTEEVESALREYTAVYGKAKHSNCYSQAK